MKFARTIIALAAMACMIGAAYAKTYKVSVRSGAKKQIMTHSVYVISGCYAAPFPKVSFRQPANGTLSFVRKKIRVAKGRKCAGKRLNGVVVFYKSKGGFRGQDRGRAYFTFPAFRGGHASKTDNANIIVNVK